MKNLHKQLFSILMSLLLVFSIMMPGVYAADIENDEVLQHESIDPDIEGEGGTTDEETSIEPAEVTEDQTDQGNEEANEEITILPKDEIHVKVRIESYDKTILPLTDITVAPYDITHAVGDNAIGNWYVENDETLAIHAIVKALENNGFDVTDGDKFQFGQGNFITNINGLEMNSVNPYYDGWMYFVNNEYAPVGVGQFELSEGDEITLFFTTDYGTVNYSWFDQSDVAVTTNEEFELKLNSTGSVNDAVILLNGEPLLIDGEQVLTDENGAVNVRFTEPGEYHLSAKRMDGGFSNITRPYSSIIVQPGNDPAPDPDPEIVQNSKSDPKPEPNASQVDTILNNVFKFYEEGRYSDAFFQWGVPELSWTEIVALQASGFDLNNGSLELPDWVEQDPGLKANDYDTTHIRYIFALLALGKDPSHAWETNRNLFAELAAQQNDKGAIGGVNKHMWAMHALDTGEKLGYEVENWNASAKSKALDYLLMQEKQGGGFAFSGQTADPDLTGMALLTLAHYQNDSAASNAIERAKQVLLQKQLDTAGWNSFGQENSNSIATVISGLVAIGENPMAEQWQKDGKTPLNALAAFQLENGAFTFTLGKNETTNMMATEQSLIAVQEIKTGKSVWQQFTSTPNPAPEPEEPTVPETPTNPEVPTEPETPTPPDIPSTQTITFSIEKRTMGQGDIVSSTQVSIQDGDTAYTVLQRIASEQGVSVVATGMGPTLYVKSIDGLAEFDGGPKSGWMYSVNGDFPQFSAGIYELSDGDQLRWQYTRNLGEDLGNIWDPNEKPDEQEKPSEVKPVKPGEGNTAPPQTIEEIKNIETAIKGAQQKLLRDGVQTEWEAIGLYKSGIEVPSSYKVKFTETLNDQVISKSGKGRMKITDVERLVLAAGALGIDPTNVDGKDFNLLDKIYNSELRITGEDSLTFQGNNGVIFALIALDSKNYEVPKNAKWSREKLVAELLKTQKSDGSWSLEASTAGATSIDITAMALTALAPYKEQQSVKQAIDKAVSFLSNVQGPTGGFQEAFVGGISSEATAQVIIGLTANGFDPRSQAFTKNSVNLIDHLLSFRADDGGFKHLADDRDSNGIATEQALQAIVAFDLYINGKGSLYNFAGTSVKPTPTPEPTPTPTPEQFTDVKGHWAADYIQQAVELGLVKGYANGTFKPNQSLTRAQAVSILVRALDLETDKKNPFTDTQNYAKETQAEIAAAYHHGLIKGQDGKFKPTEKVTRSQMALMFYRAYEIKNGNKYAGQAKAPFTDMSNYNAEAQAAASMLYDLGMATGEKGKYMPGNPTSRAQATKMLVEFLNTK